MRPAIAALKNSGSQLGQSHPVEAMRYLRQAAKAYVSYYPGAGYIVDKAFDGLDGIVEAHRADINDIIVRGQNSIRQVIERDGNEHSASSVLEVLAIIRRMLVEIKDLGQRAGAPIAERLELERRLNELGGSTAALFDGIAYKAPEIKAKLGEFAEYVGTVHIVQQCFLTSLNARPRQKVQKYPPKWGNLLKVFVPARSHYSDVCSHKYSQPHRQRIMSDRKLLRSMMA